jgi:hypothetical protein
VNLGFVKKMTVTSYSFLDCVEFDILDFNLRWHKARVAALRVSHAFDSPLETSLSGSNLDQELRLLSELAEEEKERALRAVFDNSRKFGMSLSKFYRTSLELGDIQDIFSQLSIPCTQGEWNKRDRAVTVRRQGCPSQLKAGPFLCNWFREAIDGLIMGIGQEERFARHASVGHGDSECLDVYFTETLTLNASQLRFAPVPPHIIAKLQPIQSSFENIGARLIFSGFSERTLFYKIESKDSKPLCGATGRLLHQRLYKLVHELFPDFRMQDLSPLAVYAEGTK